MPSQQNSAGEFCVREEISCNSRAGEILILHLRGSFSLNGQCGLLVVHWNVNITTSIIQLPESDGFPTLHSAQLNPEPITCQDLSTKIQDRYPCCQNHVLNLKVWLVQKNLPPRRKTPSWWVHTGTQTFPIFPQEPTYRYWNRLVSRKQKTWTQNTSMLWPCPKSSEKIKLFWLPRSPHIRHIRHIRLAWASSKYLCCLQVLACWPQLLRLQMDSKCSQRARPVRVMLCLTMSHLDGNWDPCERKGASHVPAPRHTQDNHVKVATCNAATNHVDMPSLTEFQQLPPSMGGISSRLK